MDQVKPRVATVWLGGCSGCHMSLLDMDERLLDLLPQMDLVYGPLVDAKEFPEDVDATLVEGAVANEEHLDQIRKIRARTRFLVAFGDCAVTGNVTALRNSIDSARSVLESVYEGRTAFEPGIVPVLLDRVLPVHHVVDVDLFLPGCPPSADLIHFVLSELLAGRRPDVAGRFHFG
jgi:NAD-reducing hydrogenase small subunit